ncbi:MAG: HEAT repeat domain-containing protein [Cocleimonas sp.]|nr:HEAT repeat domain-containing protein [Cocleimonas sp.]
MNKQTLAYRGIIQGIVSSGSQAAFITTHEESQATALYRIDASQQKLTLTTQALSCGATALTSDGKKLWFAGQDGKLYESALAKGKPKALPKLAFDSAKVIGLALLSDNRLAVLQSRQLSLIDLKKKTLLQAISYSESSAVMGASADGLWLAVGDSKGVVHVYQTNETSQQLTLSESATIHKGSVTAIQFEAEALRFYSAGADKKLFSTHAQGNLQPLDRGKNSNHNSNIHALHLGQERLFTGAGDKSIKAWPLTGGQPVSIKQGLAKISHLVAIHYQDKPSLLAVGRDATLRLVSLTPEDKFTEVKAVIRDGYTGAKQTLQQTNASEREKAITFLAAYDDKKALVMIAKQYQTEKDKGVCEKIVRVASKSLHPEATRLLENILKMSRHDGLRLNALTALIKRTEKEDLSPYEKALQSGHLDIGAEALNKLAKLSKTIPRAEQMLVKTLQHKRPPLRLLALSLLEKVYAKTSPKASLDALKVNHPDLQRAALTRLFQRNLLDSIDVKRAILFAQDQEDDQLRHTAFLVSILSRKTLTKALKTREENFARQLQELEDFDLLAKDEKPKKNKYPHLLATLIKVSKVKKITSAASPKPSPLNKLTDEDYAVLLQSMTSRHLNVCFHATLGLAVLQDQRAFGMLLSLGQRQDTSFHIGVCYALGVLGQQDAIPSLKVLLNADANTIREAAFNALEKLEPSALITAKRGLQSKHKDIHARGLKILLDTLKKKLKKADKTTALSLLKAALNNEFEAIRQETFKACLNQQLGGDEAATLHLLLDSQFTNVHEEVLNELMAKAIVKPVLDWVEPLLFELFNNPFATLRLAAFNFAIKEKKRFQNKAVLASAVVSQFIDVREAVFQHIKSNNSKKNQLVLSQLLNDQDEALREQAIHLMVMVTDKETLANALTSSFDNVKVIAATALARLGDARAYAIFDDLLSREEPHKKQEIAHWHLMISHALQGVKALGDSAGFDHVMRFIQHKDNKLMRNAAQALPWVTNKTHRAALNTLQKDERKPVRAFSSYALALLGDASAKPLIDNQQITAQLSHYDQLAALLSLGEVTPLTLESSLTASSTQISALLALATHDLLLNPDAPTLSTWALTLNDANLQMFCAGLMTCYGDETARWQYLTDWLIEQFNDDKWTISIKQLQAIATMLVYGDGHTKAQLIYVLRTLDTRASIKVWKLRYTVFKTRYAKQIQQATQPINAVINIKPVQSEWNQRAFGTYLALVHSADRYGAYDGLNTSLKALRKLHQLAEKDKQLYSSVSSCFLTLLNHHAVDIRQFVFDDLQTLGMDLATLGKVATTSPQQDIAKQGLQLLVEHYSIKESQSLLQSLIQGDDAVLSVEAYHLYRDDQGLIKTADYALQSYHLDLRQQCVNELAADKNSEAQPLLVKAVHNDHAPTAIKAATHLARQSHPQALTLLSDLLAHNADKTQQQQIIRALKLLPQVEVAEVLFNYVQHNKHNRQEASYLYQALAEYRHRELFDALLQRLASHPKEAKWIQHTLILTTGYDQPFDDFYETHDDLSWIDQQHPRQDALLIQLFNEMIKRDHHEMAANLIPVMGWPKAKAVSKATDNALQAAIPVIDPQYLDRVVATLSYRLKRRESKAESLLQLLTHKESELQFLAAEALAVNGHQQGFAILLAAADYQENDHYRERAVLALGKSGDQRALDKLLALAQDKEHALNEVAIEAIGSMGEAKEANKIFELLKSSLRNADYYSDMNLHALNGLRWFNTLAAWQIICAYIDKTENAYDNRQHAVTLLQYWDTNASRALLLKLLKQEKDDDVTKSAYQVAQRLWKTEDKQTSEVDYALIQGYYPEIDDKALERITLYAPSADLLGLLSAHYADEEAVENILQAIDHSLLKRTDYRAKDLGKGLESHSSRIVNTTARLITRMDKLTKPMKEHLQRALERYYQRWNEQYNKQHGEQSKEDINEDYVNALVDVFAKDSGLEGEALENYLNVNRNYVRDNFPNSTSEASLSAQSLEENLEKTTQTLQQLLWSAVKHDVINHTVVNLLASHHKSQRPFQLQVLNALLSLDKLSNKVVLKSIEHLLRSPAPQISHLANQLLQMHGKNKPLDWRQFQGQADIVMNKQFNKPLIAAAAHASQQAQALPILITKQDTVTLSKIASDEQQQETVRMGAIEGLARIVTEEAGEALSQLHKNNEDKDISKAAYRALRRQQRSQAKVESSA